MTKDGPKNRPGFVFINYSDPTHDRKSRKNKHLVTKYATIHACKTRKRRPSDKARVVPSDVEEEEDTPSPMNTPSSTPSSPEPAESSNTISSSASSIILQRRSTLPADGPEEEEEVEVVCLDHGANQDMPWALCTPISCSSTDPFDVLPEKPTHQMWKLLNSWLSAGAQVDAAQDGYRMQVSVIRRSWFWPMVNRNKATFNAAVAWIAISTNDCSMSSTMGTSLANALPALRHSLMHAEHGTAESAWYSIILLLSIAVRLHDTDAVYAHYRGLASLLARRPDLLVSANQTTIPFSNSFLYTFVAAVILANYDSYRQEPSLAYLPHYVLKTGPEMTAILNEKGLSSGFIPLHRYGILSDFLFSTINHIIPLQSLYARARRRELDSDSAAALLDATWCCMMGLYIPKPIMHGFEEYIWLALMLYWHVERQSRSATSDLSLALSSELMKLEYSEIVQPPSAKSNGQLSGLYDECLLWLTMCAGTHVSDDTAKDVLGRKCSWLAKDVLHLHSLADVHRVLRRFFWTHIADEKALVFWETWCQPTQDSLGRAVDFWSSGKNSASDRPFGTLSLLPTPATRTFKPLGTHDLPCQFCRQVDCTCKYGKADMAASPDHLRGSLWAVPPSIFEMFCRPVWRPHQSRELPLKFEVKELERGVEW